MCLIVTGRAFQSRGPATEKALSPNFVLEQGMSNSLVFADRSLAWPGIVEILIVVSAMQDGLLDWCRYRQCTSQDRACNESYKRPITSVATAWYHCCEHVLADWR